MPSDLYQLVYRSSFRSGRVANTLQALREIVKASNRNNCASGITGFLIFDGETFLQILEGVRSQVEITYRRISADPAITTQQPCWLGKLINEILLTGGWVAYSKPFRSHRAFPVKRLLVLPKARRPPKVA